MLKVYSNDTITNALAQSFNCRAAEYKFKSSSKYGDDNLSFVCKDNPSRIITAHLNINSLGNKFVFASKITYDVDISKISESKHEDSFRVEQFHIEYFGTPIGLDRNPKRR